MSKQNVLNLIKDYISCSQYMCGCLKEYYNITGTTLLAARRNPELIPKEGRLPDGIYFKFHGGGCFFEFENGEIDVDFGPDDRCDGFDFYRLKDFLLYTKKSVYEELINEAVLKVEFENLIRNHVIYNPKWHPGTDLYYLTGS